MRTVTAARASAPRVSIAHVSAHYRPRLDEVVCDLKRRINGAADIIILERG